MKLDDKGRCCGRKPIRYRGANAHHFCDRCERAFSVLTSEQIENLAWKFADGAFVRKAPTVVRVRGAA